MGLGGQKGKNIEWCHRIEEADLQRNKYSANIFLMEIPLYLGFD